MSYEMPDFAKGRKWVDIETGENSGVYWFKVYECPQCDLMLYRSGYESEEGAYKMAVSELDRIYGKGNWVA
jgi:hypothetical protein